jgi:hypothetical protein
VDSTNVGAYLAAIERERARALSAYGRLLVPGLELTYNDPNPDGAGHAVAVGLLSLVAMDDGPPRRCRRRARRRGRARGVAPARPRADAGGAVPNAPFRAALARAARAVRSRRAFQRGAAVRLGGGGGAAGRRVRRPAPARTASRLDDARSLRAGRGGAGRLSALAPTGVPDAPRADPFALAA